jgi:hypothetical protein
MKKWFRDVRPETWFSLFLTLAMVAVANTVFAAGGGGVGGWEAMGNVSDDLQGIPAFAAGSIMLVGSAVTLAMGEIGLGAKRIALATGATGIMTNAATVLSGWGVAGALS